MIRRLAIIYILIAILLAATLRIGEVTFHSVPT